jgi:hypothetical protein
MRRADLCGRKPRGIESPLHALPILLVLCESLEDVFERNVPLLVLDNHEPPMDLLEEGHDGEIELLQVIRHFQQLVCPHLEFVLEGEAQLLVL